MMENTIDNSGNSAININILIIPGSNKLRNNPRDNLRSNLTGWLIENLSIMLERRQKNWNFGHSFDISITQPEKSC